MAFKPIHPIEAVNGYAVKGWYNSFLMGTPEESREALINSWTTPEQRKYNREHTTCPRCRGRGYTRKDGRVGCNVCTGTGSIPLEDK